MAGAAPAEQARGLIPLLSTAFDRPHLLKMAMLKEEIVESMYDADELISDSSVSFHAQQEESNFELQPHPDGVFRSGENNLLHYDEYLRIIKRVQANPSLAARVGPLLRPSPGSIVVFMCSLADLPQELGLDVRAILRRDGYRLGHSKGVKSLRNGLKKAYNFAKLDEQQESDEFRRYEFWMPHDPQNVVVFHYLGNSQIASSCIDDSRFGRAGDSRQIQRLKRRRLREDGVVIEEFETNLITFNVDIATHPIPSSHAEYKALQLIEAQGTSRESPGLHYIKAEDIEDDDSTTAETEIWTPRKRHCWTTGLRSKIKTTNSANVESSSVENFQVIDASVTSMCRLVQMKLDDVLKYPDGSGFIETVTVVPQSVLLVDNPLVKLLERTFEQSKNFVVDYRILEMKDGFEVAWIVVRHPNFGDLPIAFNIFKGITVKLAISTLVNFVVTKFPFFLTENRFSTKSDLHKAIAQRIWPSLIFDMGAEEGSSKFEDVLETIITESSALKKNMDTWVERLFQFSLIQIRALKETKASDETLFELFQDLDFSSTVIPEDVVKAIETTRKSRLNSMAKLKADEWMLSGNLKMVARGRVEVHDDGNLCVVESQPAENKRGLLWTCNACEGAECIHIKAVKFALNIDVLEEGKD